MHMKKILLLGGSTQQIPAIQYAKKQGYFTILCDYLEDNPGQYHADKFYCVSTTDQDAILQIAKDEDISGVVAYASDPAAPVAAYTAELMGLPTNPFRSVKILAYKDLFRQFLKANGFNSPVSASFETYSELIECLGMFSLPILIKPVDSSGSKGVSIVDALGNLESAFNTAFSQSRKKRVVVEEFICMDHRFMVGGDIFVQGGDVVFLGILNCHRDQSVNPLVPVGKSHPVLLSEDRIARIKQELQKIVDLLRIEFGAFNVEIMFDKHDKLYIIEMGPRNGGNIIPDLLNMIHGVDLVKATIESAMGNQDAHFKQERQEAYFATHNIHSSKDGRLKDIVFGSGIRENIVKKVLYNKIGDTVHYFDAANKALGIVFLRFKSIDEMLEKLDNINDYIEVRVSER